MRFAVRYTRAVLGIAMFAACACTNIATAQVPDQPGWKLAWHDEFDPEDLNTNWNVINLKDSYNNEKQYYRPEQAAILNNALRITATNQPLDGKPYHSARLESKAAFPIGRFEARMDLPTTQGMWPAFWLLPNGVQWPTAGEIDILENKGSSPTIVSSAYHWQTNPGPCCGQHQYVVHEYSTTANGAPVDFHNGYHTYAVEWEADKLRFYVDNVLHYTVTEISDRPIFETPMNIILNLAIGGDFGGDPNGTTVFPQTMDVDYVRVWQRPSPTAVAGDFNGDNIVDAADYTVWRDSQGQSGINLPADGSGNGTVGPEDYEIWKTNFPGTAPGQGATSSQESPEPTSAVPATFGLLFGCACRRSLTAPDRSK